MITDSYLQQLETTFIKHGVILAYLFGSQAEGRARPASDVDIAILLPDDMPRTRHFEVRLSLIGELVEVFGRDDIDVVVLNDAPALLLREVVQNGKVIYEDSVTRPAVDFVVRAMSYYADTEHFRKLSQEYLLERVDRRDE